MMHAYRFMQLFILMLLSGCVLDSGECGQSAVLPSHGAVREQAAGVAANKHPTASDVRKPGAEAEPPRWLCAYFRTSVNSGIVAAAGPNAPAETIGPAGFIAPIEEGRNDLDDLLKRATYFGSYGELEEAVQQHHLTRWDFRDIIKPNTPLAALMRPAVGEEWTTTVFPDEDRAHHAKKGRGRHFDISTKILLRFRYQRDGMAGLLVSDIRPGASAQDRLQRSTIIHGWDEFRALRKQLECISRQPLIAVLGADQDTADLCGFATFTEGYPLESIPEDLRDLAIVR